MVYYDQFSYVFFRLKKVFQSNFCIIFLYNFFYYFSEWKKIKTAQPHSPQATFPKPSNFTLIKMEKISTIIFGKLVGKTNLNYSSQ